MKYKLKKIDSSEFSKWNQLVYSSRQGSIFNRYEYLDALKVNYKLYFVIKGESLVGGLILVVDSANKKNIIVPDHLIYGGIIFSESLDKNTSKSNSKKFQVTEDIVKYLTKKYDNIEIQFSPHIEDIRPFLWHNYHSKKISEKFSVDVRYTSFLNIREINDYENLEDNIFFKKLGYSRRQEIRYGKKYKVSIFQSDDTKIFYSLARKVNENKYSPDILEKLLKDMKSIIESLKKIESLVIFYAKDSKEEIASATVFCWDNKRAYYLFGVNKILKNERYIGSQLLWCSFVELQKAGVEEVDLEGVNSPERGWFKLSFGGSLKPYYKLFLKK